MRIKVWAAITAILLLPVTAALAQDPGFLERFSLANDRSEALSTLIPGTEEYYYYHCLHYQNTGQFSKVDELLPLWLKRYKSSPLLEEIQNRQALFAYGKDSKRSIDYLTRKLDLHFDHQREAPDEKPGLPTRLDPKSISENVLLQRTLSKSTNLGGLGSRALERLSERNLSALQLRQLLSRVDRPDFPNLAAIVAKDLGNPDSAGFGSLPVHGRLLKSQMDELLKLLPDIKNSEKFVGNYIARLAPNPDKEWRRNAPEYAAYLTRLWEFVGGLNPAFNSLKAHVLYHRLLFDRSQGTYDRERFLTYIKLPRPSSDVNPEYLDSMADPVHKVNLAASFQDWTHLPPVGADEAVVRDYLAHFFVQDESFQAFAPYVAESVLKPAFAEAKLENGIGDAERWYSLLTPEQVRELQDRVDLDFSFLNHELFAADEVPHVDLYIKNVRKLIVRVFEINTLNYYRDRLGAVPLNLNLDGLVPNDEREIQYDAAPLRRVMRSFEFPQLKKRGVYVVEFIGNGKSSRLLIRKGDLHLLERMSTAGHVFAALDEANRKVGDAEIFLGGQRYTADPEGEIVVPFTREPAWKSVVVKAGDFAQVRQFDHRREQYSLFSGFYVDREALLKGRKAEVLVRPQLQIHGTPVTLSVLQDVRLSIVSVDRENIRTTLEVPDFRLYEDRESVYQFRVPDNLAGITFTLKARVTSLTENRKLDLEASSSFGLNGIDKSERTDDLHLHAAGGQWFLELLGKNGEAKAHRPVAIELKHRDFAETARASLQTDATGRIHLGALTDIEWVGARETKGSTHTWRLPYDSHSYPEAIHGRSGEPLLVPYMATAGATVRSEVSLLETRSGAFVQDRADAVRLREGFLEISNLPAGDYDLLLKKTGERVALRMTEGEPRAGWLLSSYRKLEVRNPRPLQIVAVNVAADSLTIRLANASKFTRIHVAATRFMPPYTINKSLAIPPGRNPDQVFTAKQVSEYESGRELGQEYRYILERRYVTKFPGNMLRRPELLLNPWAVQPTTAPPPPPPAPAGGIGGGVGARIVGAGAGTGPGGASREESDNLDFLGESSIVLANLRPDGDTLKIERKALGAHQQIFILAVDPENTVYRSVSLEETQPAYLDLRLARALDPAKHYLERKEASVVGQGGTVTVSDTSLATIEPYDSIGSVYRLFMTISGDRALGEFGFVTDWPKLTAEQKREVYSRYACHELHLFLYHKDRPFFDQVVKPYLSNKRNKTFLDHWFLGDDLSSYANPWEFDQLNAVERILLGQKIAAEGARIGRSMQDAYDLLSPDIERLQRLFLAALRGSAMDASSNLPLLRTSKMAGFEMSTQPRSQVFSIGGVTETVSVSAALKSEPAYFLRGDAAKREAIRTLYRLPGNTEEYAESDYYRQKVEEVTGDLITVNDFWLDYSGFDGNGPFLSGHFTEASRNLSEMMFALAVLDLPFEPGKHEISTSGATLALKAASPMVVFHKEIREAGATGEKTPILVGQNFFRLDDRYKYVGKERVDRYVSGEFMQGVVYGCQVVVTNPTSSNANVDVLLQIPEGSIPVKNGLTTRSMRVKLEPYATRSLEYHFYFPKPGRFHQYPAHVARDGNPVAWVPPVTMEVVDRPRQEDRTSWAYVSGQGSNQDVLGYLQENNMDRLDLDKIAWRMRTRSSYESVIELLRNRHVYEGTLWSYGFLHNDRRAMREYLQHSDGFLSACGEYAETPLITIDPVERKTYQHLEYRPLINRRAHPVDGRVSVSESFYPQYMRFLKVLSYHPALSVDDHMEAGYYLLLQDRVEEALAAFAKVNRDLLKTQIQYDYMQAYLDFSRGQPADARAIAARYAGYPVDRWRGMFGEVLRQSDEIEGRGAGTGGGQDLAGAQARLAATEPSLDLKVEAGRILLSGRNAKACVLNFYRMDTELLFSRSPFVQEAVGQFSWLRQNRSLNVELPPDGSFAMDVPADLQNVNLMVEAVAGGVRKTAAYTAHQMNVQIVENYGQVIVTEEKSGKALPKVYVKVYARRTDGSVAFYKDGYTDLRGRFDYVSLNTDEIKDVSRLALLIASDTHGSVIREAAPPSR